MLQKVLGVRGCWRSLSLLASMIDTTSTKGNIPDCHTLYFWGNSQKFLKPGKKTSPKTRIGYFDARDNILHAKGTVVIACIWKAVATYADPSKGWGQIEFLPGYGKLGSSIFKTTSIYGRFEYFCASSKHHGPVPGPIHTHTFFCQIIYPQSFWGNNY